MGILLTCDNLKRYWRRRRYQRLSSPDTHRKKLKILRLGGSSVGHRTILNLVPQLKSKMFSPVKLLAKFHEAYVDMMIGVACKAGKINKVRALGGERIAKSSEVVMVPTTCEEIDSTLALEIYKRLAASRQLSG